MHAEDLCLSFEERQLFADVALDLKKGDRAFLVGDNGTGKTTLFRVLLGEIAPNQGKIQFGTNVHIGYYDQAQVNLDPEMSVIEAVLERCGDLTVTSIRTALGAFLFRGDDIEKKIGTLSGGERARVALCILMLSKANLLFLDEPTNHLDIASKEALEDALLGYDGTLLVVSHDRYFIRKLATKIWELENKKITCYAGGYQYYLEEREKSKSALPKTDVAKKQKDAENPFAKKREQESALRKLKAKVGRIEKVIEETETEISRCKERIAQPDFASDYQALMEATEKLHILEEKLQGLYAEWEEYSSALE